MAAFVLTDTTVWFGQYDLQPINDEVSLTRDGAALDCTTFADAGWRNRIIGLRSAGARFGLKTDYDTPFDLDTINNMNTTRPCSILEDPSATPAEGDGAFLFRSGRTHVDFGGSIGEIARGNVDILSRTGADTPLVRGELGMPKGTQNSTQTGTGSQIGALSASQKMYAAVHVFATAGGSPTLDVTIESDDNSGFTSAVTRVTFTQATAATSEWQAVSGAITDDWWRVVGTYGGTGTITYAVTLGIA